MKLDEILAEVHRVRDTHAEKFNFDLQAIFEDLKASESKRIAEGHAAIATPFQLPTSSPALQRTRFVRR